MPLALWTCVTMVLLTELTFFGPAFWRPWLYSLAGVVACPMAIAMFVLVSGIFPGNDRSFVEQLAYMVRHPFIPLYVGVAGGGIVFGLGYGTRAEFGGPVGSVRSAGLGRL